MKKQFTFSIKDGTNIDVMTTIYAENIEDVIKKFGKFLKRNGYEFDGDLGIIMDSSDQTTNFWGINYVIQTGLPEGFTTYTFSNSNIYPVISKSNNTQLEFDFDPKPF